MTYNKFRLIFWVVAIVCGLIQTSAYSQAINQDGVSYLDMAGYAATGDLEQLVNGQWSPLYPALMTVVISAFHPSAEYMFPAVQTINFICLIFVMISFESFLKQLIKMFPGEGAVLFQGLCYMLFLWGTFMLIGVNTSSPDLLMSGFVYAAVAMILRLREANAGVTHGLILGTALAFGYFAKAVMFPLALVFIGTVIFTFKERWRGIRVASAALLLFFLIISPYVYLLSAQKGRLTFGESWKVIYAAFVNGEPWGFNKEAPPDSLKKLPKDVKVYSFTSHAVGTYPIAYDPSYWREGQTIEFDLVKQIKALVKNLVFYYNVVFKRYIIFLLGLVVLIVVNSSLTRWLKCLVKSWTVFIVPVFALILYSFIYIEERMVGVFVTVIFASLYLALGGLKHGGARRVMYVIMVFAGLRFGFWMAGDILRGLEESRSQLAISSGLARAGLKEGDPIGFIGAHDTVASSIKYAGLNIRAFASVRGHFDRGADPVGNKILKTLKDAGCLAALTANQLIAGDDSRWKSIKGSGYYLIDLREKGSVAE